VDAAVENGLSPDSAVSAAPDFAESNGLSMDEIDEDALGGIVASRS